MTTRVDPAKLAALMRSRDTTDPAAVRDLLAETEPETAAGLRPRAVPLVDATCAACGRYFFHTDECPTPDERSPGVEARRPATESNPAEDRQGITDADILAGAPVAALCRLCGLPEAQHTLTLADDLRTDADGLVVGPCLEYQGSTR